MCVLLVDLDDTLIPDQAARDLAMQMVLARFVSPMPLGELWPIVREEWRASGLRDAPSLAGVSSWEAMWTDFDTPGMGAEVRGAGGNFQTTAWRRLLPEHDAQLAGAAFRQAREKLVRTFKWVPTTLAKWGTTHDLWCVTNGSSWLQRRKLLLAGLESAFSTVIISGEVGAQKPDPEFHREVNSRLATSGSTVTAVIGDSDASDGALASALGVPFARVQTGSAPSNDYDF